MGDQIVELIRDLQKPFSRAGARAEAALIRLGDATVEPVAALLFAEPGDSSTQDAAVRVLGGIGTPSVTPHLLRAVTESKHAYYAAARFLAGRRDPVLLAALLEIARSGPRFPAGAALTALGECDERSILPDVLEIVRTRADEAREAAIAAASQLGGHAAFDVIAPLLTDPDSGVRWAAAGALTEMAHPQAGRHLAAALAVEERELLVRRLAECLLELKAPDLLPAVFAALKRIERKSALHEPLAEVRGGNPAEIAPYLMAPEADADVRIAAAIALGASENAAAVAPLLAARRDADSAVRGAVRRALKRLRRAGVSVPMPPMSLRDRAASVLELLSLNFRTPSSEGFSAYRTGWIGHLAFSTVAAATLYAIASTWLGADPLFAAATGVAGVILLWWAGVLVGVCSHHVPLLMLAAVAVILGSIVLAGSGRPFLFLGLPIALAAHMLMFAVGFVLKHAASAVR